ncbi:hypothetical protein BDV26DRAFT_292934 [Aspergillus bertholletiae]|uniref:Xylanolytic transcriptional activator regulatory domain-containing protein n=1 Tax=Aspergillus bertholletiae TaxID=1226010 RepID=A0A5N7B7I8_9EURO|nr:hypothetical protein BDV26DRAFT_292934 [Aspergillus bertholletiae]
MLCSSRGPGDSAPRNINRDVDKISSKSPPKPGISLDGHDTSQGPSSRVAEGPRQVRHKTTLPVETIRSPAYVYQANEVNIIRRELDLNSSLSTSRRHVLESALSLISDFSNPSHSVESSSYDEELGDSTPDNVGLPELFFMMMNPCSEYSTPWKLHWPDHISPERFETMCLAVVNGQVTGQIASQYKVCIFARAVTFINRWLRICTSSQLAQALEASKKKYITSALRSIQQLNILHKPSLLMLQSLLSAVNLMQTLGDTTQAWIFTAFASRILVALGYHSVDSRMLEECDRSHEIRRCIRWCYYFDKVLSMLLVRPPSLPALSVEPASLLPSRQADPLDMKANILIKLAHVLDGALSVITPDGIPDNRVLGVISRLEVELQDIWEELCETRAKSSDPLELRLEWDAVDFTYHSIITTVLRLNSVSLHDHHVRERCLSHARRALRSMNVLQYHILRGEQIYHDFVFWTVLLYPLTPFFIIFCNVIATSNREDYTLLTQITAALSRIKEYNPSIFRLHGLFSQFTALCDQLYETIAQDASQQSEQTMEAIRSHPISVAGSNDQNVSTYPQLHESLTTRAHSSDSTQPGSSEQQVLYSHALDPGPSAEGLSHQISSMWDDGLMWELFNIQPTVEWFDAGYKDSVTGP